MSSGWQSIGALPGNATTFTDSNIAIGSKYEYQFIKNTSGAYTGYGYISAGIRVPVTDYFGKIVVVVENSLAGPLAAELGTLQSDLIGDGWTVLRRDVSMNDSPASVKELIKAAYDSDPANVRAVLLFGHVPVPYSGDIAPDGHANHKGAWPADVFYGDMDGTWSDQVVNTTSAERQANWNIPGDGKFDQSEIPSSLELMVGRVDLHNMTCYANKPFSRSELDLMRQYLNKNHAFRSAQTTVQRRALVCDNFSDKGSDPIGGSAWRNFAPFFGAANIQEVPWDGYFPAATAGSYLWSYASGGGSYYYSMGVGTSDDFALQDVQVVFTMFMGSYFGDWNNESNFIRAALGSGSVLASSYSGFPHALYFPMGLGEPIGYGIWLSQNNGPGGLYPPWNQGTSQIHVSLHGDPTLRMHPVKPVSALNSTSAPGTARLAWTASSDQSIVGYHVYRSTTPVGPFEKITLNPISETLLADSPPAGTYTYMVRAIKLEESASGTYFNPSQGVFAQAVVSGAVVTPPGSPTLQATAVSHTVIDLAWADLPNENGYRLESKTGAAGVWGEIATPSANATTYSHTSLAPSTTYFFRLRAFNAGGTSGYSGEVSATTGASIPAAPTAQASPISHNAIRLQWNDVSGETTYKIERRTAAGNWAQIATPAANITSYEDSALIPATAYYYRVRAANTAGDSPYSSETFAYTDEAPPQAPAAPVLQGSAVSHAAVNLSWNDGPDELSYKVESRTEFSAWTDLATLPANTISFQHTGLTATTRYHYRIRAFNSQGYSAYSDEISVTTAAPPLQPPATPALASTGISHSHVTLQWSNVADETGFMLELKNAGGTWSELATLEADVISFTHSNLAALTTYTYRITAFNAAGASAFSPKFTVTTQAPPLQAPTPPVLAGTAASDTAIHLTWDAIPTAAEYRVEQMDSGGTWVEIARLNADATSYQHAGLAASTRYQYRARAFNAAGFSAYSNEVPVTTLSPPLQPPLKPFLRAGVTSHDRIELTWNDVERETAFSLQRRTATTQTWTMLAPLNADQTSYIDGSVSPSTEYLYRIEATNEAGSSGFSEELRVTSQPVPLEPPAAPVLSVSVVSHSELKLDWNNVSTATGFIIERRSTGGTSWTERTRLSASQTTFQDTGLAAATEYSYRSRAENSAGASPNSVEVSATTLEAPMQTESSVTFVETDAVTSGLWPLNYGVDGLALANQPPALPENIRFTIATGDPVTWQAGSEDPRALIDNTGSGRVAAAWSGNPVSFALNIPRGAPRRVAFYFLDWNRTGSAQEVTIRDTATGTNLDTRAVSDFQNGKYLVYNIEGNVSVSVQNSTGPALLSGIFFGNGVPAPISDRPLTFTVLERQPGALRVRLDGDSGQRFKVQMTRDWNTWSDITQSILLGPSININIPMENGGGTGFFRTVNTR